jgi:CheY-like chemotaxis protein
MLIADKEIMDVCVIDDNLEARDAWSLTIEDSKLRPYPQNESVSDFDEFISYLQDFDAIVTDHHLKTGNYFPINGAEVVYRCYDYKIPSILVTRYDDNTVVDEIRKYRDKIPVIISQEDYDPDTLKQGLEMCINEFKGTLKQERKLWRSFIRIDDIDKNYAYLTIPAWNPNKVISISKKIIEDEILNNVNPDMKLFAKVNIGAENALDLYFKNWELK